MGNENRSGEAPAGIAVLTVVVAVAVLYFARVVLIPLALAVLGAFLLAPLVVPLRRWGLGRGFSAVSVVLLAFVTLALLGMTMASQLADLGRKLPEYQENVKRKVESVRASGGGLITRATLTISNLSSEFAPASPSTTRTQPGEEKPVPVEIRRSTFSPIEIIQKILGSVFSVLLTAIIVVVFVIFMLIEQEDLRDRLIRLGGAQRVSVTTKMLDDAGNRLSRYLLALLIVNTAYGTAAGVGLYFLGVPNPALWGMLAALLRYIPYVGIWIAASMPALLAFAVEPGWAKGPGVFALYFGIDLLAYNFVEPFLYGSSTGISPLAILVAAVFWAWLWGPVGLLLSTPLTVCVVVLGRYVPQLEFLSVLLADEPVLRPGTRLYQRMFAMDLEGANDVVEDFLKASSLEGLYDSVIIPALSLAEEDRHRGKLDVTHQRFMFENTRAMLDDLAESRSGVTPGQPSNLTAASDGVSVLCIPARDQADELAALMLVQLLKLRGVSAKHLQARVLAEDAVREVIHEEPGVVCACAVPPFGYTHARYLCRRLRSQFANLKRVAAILTEGDSGEVKRRQPAIAADEITSSLKQTVDSVAELLQRNTP